MPNGPAAPAGLDLAALGTIESELGRDSVCELITLFVDDAGKQLVGAREAAAAGNADRVKRVAHRLKSMSHYLGARALWSRCDLIEQACRSGQPLDLVAEVGKLEALLGVARSQFDAYMARAP